MKTILLFNLLLYSIFISAIPQKDILKAKYDSCHSYINENSKLFPVNSLRHARMEIEIGETLKEQSLILTGYIDASRTLYNLYQYQMALEYAHKALQLSIELNDWDKHAEAQRLCGAIYTSLNDINNAHKYLNQAITYYTKKNDTTAIIRSMGTMAISLGKNKQYEECIQILNKIYNMGKAQNNYETMLITLKNLSNAYWEYTGDSDKGLRFIDSIRSIIPPVYITPLDSIYIQNKIGINLYMKKNYPKAKEVLKENYEQAKKFKSFNILSSTIQTLIKLAKEENDFKTATKYWEELFSLHDSIASKDIKKRIGEMEVIYELSQKNAAIDHLIQKNKWNRQRLILILFIIIAISISIIIKIQTPKKIISSKTLLLSEELKNKKNGLTNMTIHYYELRKTVTDLYVKIKQANQHCKDEDSKKSLSNICTSLAHYSILNETKNKINNYIDTNYSDYISRLSKKFPELTDSEKRICTMLLINYTTKEISDVLNISEKSINNIRSKIRKKMNVPKDFSITQFLKSI